jgi:hypothetical protein
VEANVMVSKLMENWVIEKCPKPMEGISTGMFILSGEKIRMVVDYSPLNRFVKRPVTPFSMTQMIREKMQRG